MDLEEGDNDLSQGKFECIRGREKKHVLSLLAFSIADYSVFLMYAFDHINSMKCYDRKIVLLRHDNEIETGNSADANVNQEESSNVSSFWGEDAVSDDDDSSASSESDNDLEETESQSTGQAILAIAIPALAGLAIDPLMVRGEKVVLSIIFEEFHFLK